MILWMFLKVFADSCLCFSILGSFVQIFHPEFSFIWPAVLCGGGATIAALFTDQGKYEQRYLGILLPLASFLLAGDLTDVMALLPTAFYSAILILRGEFSMEYYSFRDQFKRILIFWALFLFTIYGLHYVESLGHGRRQSLSLETCLLYGICYMVSGVILLRQLRLGQYRYHAMDGRQLAWVCGCTGVGVLGIVALERWLADHGSSIIRLIWDCFLMLMGFPFVLLGNLFTGFVSLFPEGTSELMEKSTGESSQTGEALPPPATEEMAEEVIQQAEQGGYPWWFAILVVGILLVILIVMLRILKKRRTAPPSDLSITDVSPNQKERTVEKRSNRAKVRRYYREFLRSERHKGMKLCTNQTSADILSRIDQTTDRDSASRLREIYLLARYKDGYKITPDDVREAKVAMKNSK